MLGTTFHKNNFSLVTPSSPCLDNLCPMVVAASDVVAGVTFPQDSQRPCAATSAPAMSAPQYDVSHDHQAPFPPQQHAGISPYPQSNFKQPTEPVSMMAVQSAYSGQSESMQASSAVPLAQQGRNYFQFCIFCQSRLVFTAVDVMSIYMTKVNCPICGNAVVLSDLKDVLSGITVGQTRKAGDKCCGCSLM